MNANELAEIIQHLENARYMGASKAATMLRQQQAEIEALKAHPVKELTDEEILIVWTSSNFVGYTETGHIDEIFFNKFARAILRKAQEK